MDTTKVRDDFPIYSSDQKDLIYLDNACQTFRPRQVMEAMNEYYNEFPACGGRSVHRLATQVSIRIDEAREKVAGFLGSPSDQEIVFTKNCTEALNLVIKGFPFQSGDVVLTTDIEHNSNHAPWIQIEGTRGIKRKFVSTPNGLFDLEEFKALMSKKVRMVSMVHENNVNGSFIPAREVIEVAHDYGALVMLDGAQAAPHVAVDLKKLDVDAYTISMHKMLGPAGVGVMYAKKDLLDRLDPLITGGGGVAMSDYDSARLLPPPEKFESGLQNYSGIIGSAAALDYLSDLGMDEVEEHCERLNLLATDGIKDIDGVKLLAPLDAKLRGSILSFNVEGMSSHDVAMIVDEMAMIMVRSGMHCAHPYFIKHNMDGCVRASFYLYNSIEECKRFVDAMQEMASTFSD